MREMLLGSVKERDDGRVRFRSVFVIASFAHINYFQRPTRVSIAFK